MAIDLGSGIGNLVGSRPDYGRGTRSLFEAILRNAAGKPVFTADYYAVDGVTGKVAAFIDWNDSSHTLAQSTSALQVNLPTVDSRFAGALTITATQANTRYVSSRAASSWRFLHDGTGCSVVHACTVKNSGAVQVLGANCRNNVAGIGYNGYHPSSSSEPKVVTRTSAGGVLFSFGLGVQTVFDTALWHQHDFSGTDASIYSRGRRATSAVSGTPSSADGDRTFSLLNGDTSVSDFTYYGAVAFAAYLTYQTPDQRYVIARFMRERYGI